MSQDSVFKVRGSSKYLLVASLFVCGVSVHAQQNWTRLSLSSELRSAIPLPSRSTANPCASLPKALELPDSSVFDAQTIACLDSLVLENHHTSPALESPAGEQLTEEEVSALRIYLLGSVAVNTALRSGVNVSQYREYIQTLNSAISKRPVYRNVTFRGSRYPPVPLEELRPGAVYTDLTFISTSRSYNTAKTFATMDGYLYVILSKTGRQLYYDATFPLRADHEQEVLFQTNTKLRIITAFDSSNGTKMVYLEELL